MKTLYVTDLDGTLLTPQDDLSPFTRETLTRLSQAGLSLTYATARSWVSAHKVTAGWTPSLPVIVYNGAFLADARTGAPLSTLAFDPDEAGQVQATLQARGLHPLVYAFVDGRERVSYRADCVNDGLARYLSLRLHDPRFRPVIDEIDLYAGQPFYFTVIGEKNELQPVYDVLHPQAAYTLLLQQELYRPEYWCEIMPRAATKAAGVLRLKQEGGFDRVVGFGDALNDLSLFAVCDEAYAVGNAVPELRAAATGILGSNVEDGVARYLATHAR
jgi:Cof subfamily protein (haloacid dehalogenase superfamily)